MPPQYLFDISRIDLDQVIFDQEAIRQVNPQRGEMEHLNGIVYAAGSWVGLSASRMLGRMNSG